MNPKTQTKSCYFLSLIQPFIHCTHTIFLKVFAVFQNVWWFSTVWSSYSLGKLLRTLICNLVPTTSCPHSPSSGPLKLCFSATELHLAFCINHEVLLPLRCTRLSPVPGLHLSGDILHHLQGQLKCHRLCASLNIQTSSRVYFMVTVLPCLHCIVKYLV